MRVSSGVSSDLVVSGLRSGCRHRRFCPASCECRTFQQRTWYNLAAVNQGYGKRDGPLTAVSWGRVLGRWSMWRPGKLRNDLRRKTRHLIDYQCRLLASSVLGGPIAASGWKVRPTRELGAPLAAHAGCLEQRNGYQRRKSRQGYSISICSVAACLLRLTGNRAGGIASSKASKQSSQIKRMSSGDGWSPRAVHTLMSTATATFLTAVPMDALSRVFFGHRC